MRVDNSDAQLCRQGKHVERLRSVGIDTTLLQETGHFVIRDWADAHLKDGRFDQKKILALAEAMMEASKREGCPRNRPISHMEWALQNLPGVNDLIEYEAPANCLVTYDLSKFGGDVVVDVMRTHPMVVITSKKSTTSLHRRNKCNFRSDKNGPRDF